MIVHVGIVLLAALYTAANEPQPEAVTKELKLLQGTWRAVAGEEGGEKAPGKEVARLTMIFDGDKFSASVGILPIMSGTIQLDPTKSPKTMNLLIKKGRSQGRVAEAIYEFDGKELKICLGELGGDRPTEFKSDNGRHLMAYKREKR